MNSRHNFLVTLALVMSALAAAPAAAHAVLKSSEPQRGAILAAAPTQLILTFNEKIEAAFTSVTVSKDKGQPVATGKAAPDAANPAVVRLALPALGAGVYVVKWAVAGHDGHRRTGDFTFTVR